MNSRISGLVLLGCRASIVVVFLTTRISVGFSESLLEVRTEVEANATLILDKDSVKPLSSAEKSELQLLREPSYRSPAQKYWKLSIGNCPEVHNTAVVTDEVNGEEFLVYVDANNNRDLTDDGPSGWIPDQGSAYRKDVAIKASFCQDGNKQTVTLPYRLLRMFMLSDTKKEKPLYAYKAQYVRTGFMEIKGERYKILLQATGQHEVFSDPKKLLLGIDRNRDGKIDDSTLSAERFYDPTRPFNVGGESYVATQVSDSGDQITLRVSSQKVPPKNYIIKGEVAPDFEFTTLQGRRMKLSARKGKVVMIDFWATWCVPCVASLPELKQLSKEHQTGFEIIGISLDDREPSQTTPEAVNEFVRKNQMNWLIGIEPGGFDGAIVNAYNITSIPTNVIVDQRGIIYSVQRALFPEQFHQTRIAVDELLKK